MAKPLQLNPFRLFSSEPTKREIASRLYSEVSALPILSPHGHTDPAWFSENEHFGNPVELFIRPDHYIFRMLYSLGISLDMLGIPQRGNQAPEADPREIWRLFGEHYYAFRGTPSALWLDYVFSEIFGMEDRLDGETADSYYETIDARLKTEGFRPRALFERFNIEVLATTESPLDTLEHHQKIRDSDWPGRVITAFRPDPVIDPEFEGFRDNLSHLGDLTGRDCFRYEDYLEALRERRLFFKSMGATSTDHGHLTASTADLSKTEAEALFYKVSKEASNAEDAELFRAHMLVVMAGMCLEDGLVMQLHPGACRNHNPWIFDHYGPDKGADIPIPTDYVMALKPLLDRYGNEADFTFILFTLDESAYGRELAPLAGHYPALKLGPPWWFFDSPEGITRFRRRTIETAGFYNTVGFNDDTRAFMSIPARHDVARRIDCAYLAELVADHRMDEDVAAEVAVDLAYNLVKKAYRL